jgi:hypothetical protein
MTRPTSPANFARRQGIAVVREKRIFSNVGPVNTRFEKKMLERFFGGKGVQDGLQCNHRLAASGERSSGRTSSRTVRADAQLYLCRRGAYRDLVRTHTVVLR